jgi:hypothetical protein
MKTIKHIVIACLLAVAACGGKGKPTAPANQSTSTQSSSTAGAQRDCPAGEARNGSVCEKMCQTDEECAAIVPGLTCQEVANTGGRELDEGGKLGPVMEPTKTCQGD